MEERNATPIFINGSSETFTTVFKFNNYLQISDTIRDTTNQLLLPNEALENNTSIIYKMPIYVPDSSMHHFKKKPYEDLTSHENGNVFFIVDTMPQFPGGELALHKWIAKEIKYPVFAQENHIQGKVYVTFVVGKDGSVSNAIIARGVFIHRWTKKHCVLLMCYRNGNQGNNVVNQLTCRIHCQSSLNYNAISSDYLKKAVENLFTVAVIPGRTLESYDHFIKYYLIQREWHKKNRQKPASS